MTPIALIAAVSENGVIGRCGQLPWRIPTDLRLFRKHTLGKPIIMGRKTFCGLPQRLNGRNLIVLTGSDGHGWPYAPLVVAPDWGHALAMAESWAVEHGAAEVMVAGGASVYAEAMPKASRIYLTRVHANVLGDAHFPPITPGEWRYAARKRVRRAPLDEHPFSFSILERW